MRRLLRMLLGIGLVAAAIAVWCLGRPPPAAEREVASASPAEVPAPTRKKRAAAPAGLVRPAPKVCLAAPDVEGEADVVASAGLSYDDARASLSTFAPELVSCLGPEESPTGALLLRLTVACTGLVDGVAVVDRADWSADAAACVVDRLGYAPFPAHGLPDGDTVDWPLRYTPP